MPIDVARVRAETRAADTVVHLNNAGASLPPGMSLAQASLVKAALESAFLESWRVVMLSCAGLALAAGAFGWWAVPKKR